MKRFEDILAAYPWPIIDALCVECGAEFSGHAFMGSDGGKVCARCAAALAASLVRNA